MLPLVSLSQVFTCSDGKVKFDSEAKLEAIKAESNKLSGAVDAATKKFAFSIAIESFQGFNSALQREHFNETYMESAKYKTAEFKGKIEDKTDLSKDGTYKVKAKGVLDIHGVKKDRTIDATVTVKDKQMHIESQFDVALADHKIKIPSIAREKLAEVIKVTVDAVLKPKQ